MKPSKDRYILNYFKMKWERCFKIKRKPFRCLYKDISCDCVDPTTSTPGIGCEHCNHYGDGVRLTGAMEILENMAWTIDIKKIWNKWHSHIVIVLSLSMVIFMLIFRSCVSII